MARTPPELTRSPNDYLGDIEQQYDVRIEALDLSDHIVDGLDRYQADFDAAVIDFYREADGIERRGFEACDSIEDDDPIDSDEEVNVVVENVRKEILQEARRLSERLSSLNLQPRWSQTQP